MTPCVVSSVCPSVMEQVAPVLAAMEYVPEAMARTKPAVGAVIVTDRTVVSVGMAIA